MALLQPWSLVWQQWYKSKPTCSSGSWREFTMSSADDPDQPELSIREGQEVRKIIRFQAIYLEVLHT